MLSKHITWIVFGSLLTILVGWTRVCVAQPAVLSTGDWYKFSVTADGVVKIDYALLRAAGINPDQIDPRHIQVYTGHEGMLPQPNSAPRQSQLSEIAISVIGQEDGKFNNGDLILFFAKGPDAYHYDEQKNLFHYQNHLYSDKNFYFLTIASTPGKRIADAENVPGTYPIIQQFDDLAFYETEKYNLLKSGRQWFGEQFDATLSATIRFEIPGIVENSEMKLISHVMAQSFGDANFQVSINNTAVLTQPIIAIPNTRYGIKGRIRADTVTFNSNTVSSPSRSNQDITYQFTKGGNGFSVGYLDFFLLSIKRNLSLYGDQTIFRASASTAHVTSAFQINATSADTHVWNITDRFNVTSQSVNQSGSALTFSTATSVLQTFSVFNVSKLKAPQFELKLESQNLREASTPNLIIISHPTLLTEAQRLTNHRQSHNGIAVLVTTPEKIYHEYSGGKQDVTALRDFIKSKYSGPDSPLENVLLFGRGSYDYKDRVLANTNLVPIYESRNSLSPLETYSSDDYYAFLEDHEGEWRESPAQNHTMDIGVGRLPVKTPEEAKDVVDKLIEYDLNPKAFGAWQNELLFVADDGDFNIHHNQANQLANSIELLRPEFHVKKFFLDNYTQLERASGQYSPEASKALDLAVRKGSLIVNFTGHGNEQVWMDERILDETMVRSWKNGPQYPLFVTATCEFGRHDDPFQITTGERTLLQKKGGSIGLVTTARPVNSSTNFTLNKAFYESLFILHENSFRSLGIIFRDTKNTSTSGVANRNFSLLADPSMKLAMAESQIIFDDILTNEGSNELKGLSNIKVSGHIETGNQIDTQFSGVMQLTLFDQEIAQTTLGDENSPFNYTERANILFKGKSQVTQGAFELEFVMPRNVPADFVEGKFNGYAFTSTGKLAAGALLNNLIGGIASNPPADNTPPQIKVFMGDTTFINGGTVGPNTQMVALLEDESGINISSIPSGNNIVATLDDSETFELNEYYTADTDNFKKGMLTFPLIGLEKGRHTLTLRASDTYNNTATQEISFVVTDGVQIEIEEFYNYPNPFSESTTLEFTHSRPGEDLEVFLSLYDVTGSVLFNQHFEVEASQFRVTLSDWDGREPNGTKLGRGVYLGKLSVRSLLDGSKNEQFTKLIILN